MYPCFVLKTSQANKARVWSSKPKPLKDAPRAVAFPTDQPVDPVSSKHAQELPTESRAWAVKLVIRTRTKAPSHEAPRTGVATKSGGPETTLLASCPTLENKAISSFRVSTELIERNFNSRRCVLNVPQACPPNSLWPVIICTCQ